MEEALDRDIKKSTILKRHEVSAGPWQSRHVSMDVLGHDLLLLLVC